MQTKKYLDFFFIMINYIIIGHSHIQEVKTIFGILRVIKFNIKVNTHKYYINNINFLLLFIIVIDRFIFYIAPMSDFILTL